MWLFSSIFSWSHFTYSVIDGLISQVCSVHDLSSTYSVHDNCQEGQWLLAKHGCSSGTMICILLFDLHWNHDHNLPVPNIICADHSGCVTDHTPPKSSVTHHTPKSSVLTTQEHHTPLEVVNTIFPPHTQVDWFVCPPSFHIILHLSAPSLHTIQCAWTCTSVYTSDFPFMSVPNTNHTPTGQVGVSNDLLSEEIEKSFKDHQSSKKNSDHPCSVHLDVYN